MKKLVVLVATLSIMAIPMSAMALIFNDTTDPTGATVGTLIDVSTFDWSVDNALALDSVPLSTDFNSPTKFELYYQAALSNFTDTSSNVITGTGLNTDYQITLVAGITEEGYTGSIDGGITQSAVFSLADSGVNYFEMYIDYDTTSWVSVIDGTGYTNGTKIMEGVVNDSNGGFTVTFLDSSGNIIYSDLDQFGDDGQINDYPDIYTLEGTGTTNLYASSTYENPNWFDPAGSVDFYLDLAFNTSTVTPYLQADPAAQVEGEIPDFGWYNAGTVADPDWIQLNGYPDARFGAPSVDFLFQADGNASVRVNVVPEPSTIILLGAGLLGLVGLRIKRRKE